MPVTTRAQNTPDNDANGVSEKKPETKKPKKKSRNSVGSTVDGYTIPEVRKSLDLIRRSWTAKDVGTFSSMTNVSDQDTIYTFGLRFMLGHHRKRHQRRSRGKK
jgi:hypothetical protein